MPKNKKLEDSDSDSGPEDVSIVDCHTSYYIIIFK